MTSRCKSKQWRICSKWFKGKALRCRDVCSNSPQTTTSVRTKRCIHYLPNIINTVANPLDKILNVVKGRTNNEQPRMSTDASLSPARPPFEPRQWTAPRNLNTPTSNHKKLHLGEDWKPVIECPAHFPLEIVSIESLFTTCAPATL